MVYAQFDPAQNPSGIENANLAGINEGGSMMERAARLQEQKQTMAFQLAHQQVMQPVLQAKARADMATYAANIDNLKQTQDMRAAVAAMAPQARSDFHNLMLLPDSNDRARAGLAWISRYGQLGNIQAFSGEFNTAKDVIGQMLHEGNAVALLKLRNDGLANALEARGKIALDVADANANARQASAQIMSDGRQPEIVKLASALGDAQDDVTRSAIQDRINRITNIRPEAKSAYIQAVQAYKQAAASGNGQDAALYKAQIDKLNAANPWAAALGMAGTQPAPSAPPGATPAQVPGSAPASAPGAASAAPAAAPQAQGGAPGTLPTAGAGGMAPYAMSDDDLRRFFFGVPVPPPDAGNEPSIVP